MKRRLLFAIMGVAVLAALVFAVRETREQPAVAAVPAAPQAAVMAATSPSSVARLKALREPKPHTRLSRAADEIEVCGYGRWKLDAQGAPVDLDKLDARHSAALDTARHALGAALAASADEVTRAVGFWTQSLEVPRHDLPACDDDDCLKPYLDAWNKRLQANDAPRAALVKMAQTSTAPQVYALAYSACQANGLDFGAVCGLINVEQWARLDPDNALPWFRLAGSERAAPCGRTLRAGPRRIGAPLSRHDTPVERSRSRLARRLGRALTTSAPARPPPAA